MTTLLTKMVLQKYATELRCKHKELEAKIGDECKNSSANKFIAQIAHIKLYITETKNAKYR